MLEKKEKHNSSGGVIAGELVAPVEDREPTVDDPLLLYTSVAPAAPDHGPAPSLSCKSSFESTDHDTMRANFLPHPTNLSSDGSQEQAGSIKNSSSSSSSSGRRSKSKDSRNSLDDSIVAEEEPFIQPPSTKERDSDCSKNSQTNKFSNYKYNTPNADKAAYSGGHDEYGMCNEKEDTRVDSPIFDYKSDENDDMPIIPGIMMHVSSDMDSAFEDESEERLFDTREGQQRLGTSGNAEGGKRRRFASKPTSPPKDGRRHFRTFSSDYATNIKSFSDMVENNDTWSKYSDRHIPKHRRSAQALHNEEASDQLEMQPLNNNVGQGLDKQQLLDAMKSSVERAVHAEDRLKSDQVINMDLLPEVIQMDDVNAKLDFGEPRGLPLDDPSQQGILVDPPLSGESRETDVNGNGEPPNDMVMNGDVICEADEYETKQIAPDGGYGWLVLLGSIIVNILIPGTVKSFGILFVEFIEVFKATPSAAAWIPAISYFLYSSTGPFASALSIKYSFRTVTIVGGLLASTGLMLSYFATSIFYLYISYGIIGGLGAGLAYPIGVFMISGYFEKRRGLANGLCTSGSALGSVIIPPFLRYLLGLYGYRIAILIMGAVLLNVCLAALFYSPVELHMKTVTVRKEPPKMYAVQETQTHGSRGSFVTAAKTSNISIGKIRGSTGREVAASLPIAIPADNRRDPRRATFQIGNETPQGGDSWSLKSTDSVSPLASRILSNNEFLLPVASSPKILVTRNRPVPTSMDSSADVDSASAGANFTPSIASRSRLNLTAIPEDDDIPTPEVECRTDWTNSYSNLNYAKHQPMRLSYDKGSQIMSASQASNLHAQPGLSRTLSLASNVSNSSFRYMSTIHHGSCLMSMQYNTTVTDLASAMNVKSMKRSCWNFLTYPKNWYRWCGRASREERPSEEDELDQQEKDKRPKFMDFSLLQDPLFIIMIISLATTAIGYTNFIILLPSYAIQMGFDKSEASILLSVVAGLDFVGRIGGAALSDLCFQWRKWFFAFGLFMSGVSLTLLPLAQTYQVLAAFCAAFGLSSGAYIGLSAVILADRLGPERLGSSYGLTLFVNGIMQLLGPPICGSILESTGTFEPIFVGLGIILVFGAVIWLLLPWIDHGQFQNKEIQVDVEGQQKNE